jgi:hypothetical protein
MGFPETVFVELDRDGRLVLLAMIHQFELSEFGNVIWVLPSFWRKQDFCYLFLSVLSAPGLDSSHALLADLFRRPACSPKAHASEGMGG